MTPTLLVSVDTEEEFDWSSPTPGSQWSMDHVFELGWFQDLCDEFGVRPTYLVDYAVTQSDEAVTVLSEFLSRGTCEIGAHPHPWLNPPVREKPSQRNTYLCNLPIELQQQKVHVLTNAIREAFGVEPTAFKAGRYAIDFRLMPYLKTLGYKVDSSVIAYTGFDDPDAPDFRHCGPRPFWIPEGSDSSNGGLLEIPCTAGYNREPFTFWNRVHQFLARRGFRPLHPVGVLFHLRVLRRIVLSPELADVGDMRTLMRVMAAESDAVLNLTLHSPSVEAGHTPFVQSEHDLRRFQANLRRIFEVAVHELQARCLTLTEYHDSLRAPH